MQATRFIGPGARPHRWMRTRSATTLARATDVGIFD
jgi:hypothetical protein